MTSRRQHVPWTTAGLASAAEPSADDVVRGIGWMFNNRIGSQLDLAQFVATGDAETRPYLHVLGLLDGIESKTMIELGSGIGRMTASFTCLFNSVVACDLDSSFLERCRQTVAQFGRPERLRTLHVADGRTISLPANSVDLTFSYITLQHCHREDALSLSREAVRVTRPGGHVALHYRGWGMQDVLLWPAGNLVRMLWRLPLMGQLVAKWRIAARLGWQANRLSPTDLLEVIGPSISDITLVRGIKRREFRLPGTAERTFEGVHRSHWWIVGVVR